MKERLVLKCCLVWEATPVNMARDLCPKCGMRRQLVLLPSPPSAQRRLLTGCWDLSVGPVWPPRFPLCVEASRFFAFSGINVCVKVDGRKPLCA
jgi:hypothetical protein